jgi:uncharacterized protein YlxP (DUF503 family)
MSDVIVGYCRLELYLAGVTSLKEKRSILKSMLARMRQQFNVSAAEVAKNDMHQAAVIAFAVVSNSTRHTQESLDNVLRWIETTCLDVIVSAHEMEIL